MEIITITIEQDGDKQRIGMNHSGAVTPEMGTAACDFIASVFREQAIEAEVERRMAAQAIVAEIEQCMTEPDAAE